MHNASMNAIIPYLSALALVPLAAVCAPPVVADAATGERLTLARTTNLRKAPRIDGEILSILAKGTMVWVGNCRGDGWCPVSWNGRQGYVVAGNLGIPAAPWPPVSITASQVYDKRSSMKPGKADRTGDRVEGYEHSFILEIGTAGEWPLDGERPNFGGTIAGEVEPIENWLELEFGFTTLATAGHTEISSDLLFKKPFRLSPTVEFMAGAGPSLSRTLNGPDQGSSWSVEFALDWMFWPTKNFGWYIEPTWSVNPKNGQQSMAVSIGILIGFPK
jgi:Bacterial SH3 domain